MVKAKRVVTEWNSKSQISRGSTSLGSVNLLVGIMIKFFGTWDTYESLKAVTKSFHLWNYFLDKVVTSQTINAGWCTSGGLGLSDNIDQAQS
jgi:hypothetical protein